MATMTKKEFFTILCKAVTLSVITHPDGAADGATVDMTAAVLDYAKAELDKIEKTNEKRRESQNAAHEENAAAADAIISEMEPTFIYTARELADKHGINTQKVTALMKLAAESGKVKVQDYKVGGKGRTMKGYSLPTAADTTTESNTENDTESDTENDTEL